MQRVPNKRKPMNPTHVLNASTAGRCAIVGRNVNIKIQFFGSASGRECVKRYRVLPVMAHMPSTHSSMDCEKTQYFLSREGIGALQICLLSICILGLTTQGRHPKMSWKFTGRPRTT
ncbi:hypothetical protein TNCV_2267511 [Trichonephila clavipes]|nr:hypothetical protein TNCV_2267511 [Trichonephila clavipes]